MIETSDLQNSALLVLTNISTEKTPTFGEIVTATNLSPRSVRYAIRLLKEKDLIVERANLRDMRKVIYSLKPGVVNRV